MTALMYAAKEGHVDVVKLLVDFKANLQLCEKVQTYINTKV